MEARNSIRPQGEQNMTKNKIRASKEGKVQEEARREFARIVAERLAHHKHGCGM